MSVPTLPMGSAHLLPMSPAQAAHLAKVSRRTIMRAIETQELQAFRDNRNHWKIAPDALDRWARAQWAPTVHAHPEMPTLPTSESPDLSAKLAAAETRADVLAAQLEDVKAERDRWQAMAEKLAERPRRRWWPW